VCRIDAPVVVIGNSKRYFHIAEAAGVLVVFERHDNAVTNPILK